MAKTYTVVLHLDLEQDADDPALWNWHELLDLGPNESATVDEIFDESVKEEPLEDQVNRQLDKLGDAIKNMRRNR